MFQVTLGLFAQYVKNKFCEKKNAEQLPLTFTASSTSYNIENLKPYWEYSIQVYAFNSMDGEVSELVKFDTLETCKYFN